MTRTLVTEKNATRLGYKKLEGKATEVGFAESMPTVTVTWSFGAANIFWRRWQSRESTGLAADSPGNLRTWFLQTYMLLSTNALFQMGEDTDICTGADYWHLLPHYIKWEMLEGPLDI